MTFPSLRTLCCLAVSLLLPLGAHAADARAELDALVDQVMAKIKAGQRTEAELTPDLAKFDALLAAHAGEKTEDVARIQFMKATLFLQIIGDEPKGLSHLKQLTANFPETELAKGVARMIAGLEAQQEFAVGKILPDFAEQDLDGKPLSIAKYKSKVVLLDFWATWCPPCLAELPNVVAAYQKYHARGFEIIGVSLDREGTREKLVQFTKNREMPWPQFFDGKHWDNKLAVRYGIASIPTTFLLDGEGRVIAKNLQGDELDAELAKRLGSN